MFNIFKWFSQRTLRVEISTIFLALISFSSAIIIGFTYFKDSQAFDTTFHLSMHRLNSVVADRTNCRLSEYPRALEFIRAFILEETQLSINSPSFIDYLLRILKDQSHLTSLFIGMPNGDSLVINNISTTDHPSWFSPTDPTPQGTVFAYFLVDHSKPKEKQETWNYVSQDLKLLETQVKPLKFDTTSRPWYQGALKAGQLFWTDLYTYAVAGEKGLSCSLPIYDSSGKLLCVVGTDVPLYMLSRFLAAQKIGHVGRAYVCDATGQIIVPSPDYLHEQELVLEAFSYLDPSSKESEFYVDFEKKKYLISIHAFPLSSTKNWHIILLDPRNDLFQDILEARKETILISIAILIISTLCVIYFSKRISNPIVQLSQEVDKITHLDLESKTQVISVIKEVQMMGSSIASMRAALRSFSHYVPKDIVLELIQKGQEIALGGEKKEITIFFSDIEDFTTLSESLSVEKTTDLLEEYFQILSETILSHQGTIDKYIGDGVMAFWGAPHSIAQPVDQACLAALYTQHKLHILNEKRLKKNDPPFFTRIGINTGPVFVGNIGTIERMNYTVIGDSVNVASRLQNINKTYHTKILLGEETKIQLSDRFLVRPLGIVEVKGKKNKAKIYELMGSISSKQDSAIQATQKQIRLATLFTKAYQTFEEKNFKEACLQFQAISSEFPQDEPTQIYLKNCTL